MGEYSMPENVKRYCQSNPISESLFKRFVSDEMTVKEVKKFNEELNKRFSYIIYKIGEIASFNIDWFDYDNEGGDEYNPGKFDTDDYAQNVRYVGQFFYGKGERFDKYDNSFPTVWFYSEFEDNFKKEVDNYLKRCS